MKRTAYRSLRNARRFKVVGTPPATVAPGDVFACEGLAQPRKGAHWRLIDVWSRDELAVHQSERVAREELLQARYAAAAARTPERRDATACALKAARVAHARAAADLAGLLRCFVNPELGLAVIPADSPDLDFI